MKNDWQQSYVRLAFHIDRLFQQTGDAWFVDVYYGPPEWKTAALAERGLPARAVAEEVGILAERLEDQAYAPGRMAFLRKQVQAMETVSRKLAGERLPVEEEGRRCLDVDICWAPDAHFDAVRRAWDAALPGAGNLAARYQAWRERNRLSEEQLQRLPAILDDTLGEVRRRTQLLTPLPADEEVDLRAVRGVPWGAANWFQGQGRSKMELNLDLLSMPFVALYLMCHEGYPGHHTEAACKEAHLFRRQGCTEQAIFLTISPQNTIAEGIASLSMDVIFTPEAAAAWATEHIYRRLGIDAMDVDLAALFKAGYHQAIDDIGGNAVLLMRSGHTQEEVVEYFRQYLWEDEDSLRRYVAYLSNPAMEMYAFTYYFGRQALAPLLKGSDRQQVFARLLTEQTIPSMLAAGGD